MERNWTLEEIKNEVYTNDVLGISERMYKWAMTLAKTDDRRHFIESVFEDELLVYKNSHYVEYIQELQAKYPDVEKHFIEYWKDEAGMELDSYWNYKNKRDVYMSIGMVGSFNSSPTCKAKLIHVDLEKGVAQLMVVKPTESYLQDVAKREAHQIGKVYEADIQITWNALFS